MEVGGPAGDARERADAGKARPAMKLLAGVLLLVVIVVAVNAVLQTQAQPKLSVVQGGGA